MANRVHPTPIDADNSSGSLPAVRSDWRIGDADSMSARTTAESTLDAGYTTAGASHKAKLSISFLNLWGSPYTKVRRRFSDADFAAGRDDDDGVAGDEIFSTFGLHNRATVA